MNFELHIFNEMGADAQESTANLISAYTNGRLGETPQMLPVTPEDIQQKFLGVVAICEGDFAGYIGATQPYKHNDTDMSEVGSLWVPLAHRQKGVAHKLVGHISTLLYEMGITPYAFCNPLSKPIFEQKGYDTAILDDIPIEAFAECAKCPSKPTHQRCCDTILIKK